MGFKTLAVLISLAGFARAQLPSYIPDDLVGSYCDGLTRPDYSECGDAHPDWINSGLRVGPTFDEDDQVIWSGENCQMRYALCSDREEEQVAFDIDPEFGLFTNVNRTCGPLEAGGVRRQGSLCLIIEHPDNVFGDFLLASSGTPEGGSAEILSSRSARRSHARDLAPPTSPISQPRGLGIQSRQDPSCSSDDDCYGYTEQTFSRNIRGPEYRVCNDILPHGATCALARAVTVGQTYTGEVNLSGGLADVISLGASFSFSRSESTTVTLTTTIEVDCPGGSGYVVWFPLVEVSTGECTSRPCLGERCGVELDEFWQCSTGRPIVEAEGELSGEYAVQCVN